MTSLTKHISLAAVSAVAMTIFAGSAQSADLLPPPPPPMPELRQSVADWTGIYVGGQVGVYCFEANYYDTDPATDDPYNFGGCTGMGGVYGGYNYQLGSSFVVGFEGDYNAAFDGSIWYQPGPADVGYSIDSFASIRARLGWLANDNTLLYVTGGYGWADTEVNALVGAAPTPVSASGNLHGFVVGGGIEHAVSDSFHVKAEYLYADLGGPSYDLTPPGGCPVAGSCGVTVTDTEMHAFRLGASYNFNFGGGYSAPPPPPVPSKW